MVVYEYSLKVNHSLSTLLITAAGCLSLYLYIRPGLENPQHATRVVRRAARPLLTQPRGSNDSNADTGEEIGSEIQPAYPYHVFPGSRSVESVYGTIQVFEWGPEDGTKVLLIHGIGTPCVALGNMANELVQQGCRVMLFDLWGRGYSDSPSDLPFDDRIFATQILLVLASSHLPWTGNDAFHLVGFSLGACLVIPFATYHPHMLKSVTAICGGGILREKHLNWQTRLMYSDKVLPAWLSQWLVRRRIEPKPYKAGADTLGEGKDPTFDYDDTVCFEVQTQSGKKGITVAEISRWQLDTNEGFVEAYIKSLRSSPIYGHHDRIWKDFSRVLQERRDSKSGRQPGLKGKLCVILGAKDPVVRVDEFLEDLKQVMGEDGADVRVLDAGHELPIRQGKEVANVALQMWELQES